MGKHLPAVIAASAFIAIAAAAAAVLLSMPLDGKEPRHEATWEFRTTTKKGKRYPIVDFGPR